MSDNQKHTPTPWVLSGGALRISTERAEPIAFVIGATPENGLSPTPPVAAANAKFIVRACNSHDALVTALKAMHACHRAFCGNEESRWTMLDDEARAEAERVLDMVTQNDDPHPDDVATPKDEAEVAEFFGVKHEGGGAMTTFASRISDLLDELADSPDDHSDDAIKSRIREVLADMDAHDRAAKAPFSTLHLNKREHSTILAALRCYQHALEQGEAARFEEIATDAGEHDAMTADEIDGLCRKVNT